jgi:hypothetical protein
LETRKFSSPLSTTQILTIGMEQVVCFLDYNDLYSFNFSYHIDPGVPRPPITTQEAIRLITMKLRIDRLESPGEMDGKGLPVVHFKGTARSMHQAHDPNANSKLTGSLPLPTLSLETTLISVSTSNRHRTPHTRRRSPLDHNLPLRRRRTMA